jgi:quinol monooxygenase YgiN
MFLASIGFRALPEKRTELLSAVDIVVERIGRRSGCHRCRLFVDSEDANAFTILSEWQLPSDAESFLASSEFQVVRGLRILLREDAVVVLDDVRSRETRHLQER